MALPRAHRFASAMAARRQSLTSAEGPPFGFICVRKGPPDGGPDCVCSERRRSESNRRMEVLQF